jgi:hypothetical protein
LIDEWTRISLDQRDRVLGQHWFEDCEAFYMLTDSGDPLPSFRPLIRIPQLQVLMMHEANDLSETSPQPYIVDRERGQQDTHRERALQCTWRKSQINYHAMFTTLMSLFSGMAPLQIGFDPDARQGRGGMWAKMRDPRTFHCDPFTDYTCDWSYVILEDRWNIEKVKAQWGRTASAIKPRVAGRSSSATISDPGYGLQMPSGPMRP